MVTHGPVGAALLKRSRQNKRTVRPSKLRHNPAKLKKDITPGQVLILLGGRFRGKRVVFLKMLSSGLLLVTGPMNVNGVPLKRVAQSYCIATSASVDVSKVDAKDIDDEFFARNKTGKQKKDEKEFFKANNYFEKITPSQKVIQKQKEIDAAIKVEGVMKKYLHAKFALTRDMKPHAMKF